jgi:hypothetical protein
MDYHGLNTITIKNIYLIINMEQAINHLSSTKIYTQLDLWDVYYHIHIKCGNK